MEDHTNPRTLEIPLINGLKSGISWKFEEINNNTDAQLAAVVNPHFIWCWFSDEVQKARLVMTLKSRINVIIKDDDKNKQGGKVSAD